MCERELDADNNGDDSAPSWDEERNLQEFLPRQLIVLYRYGPTVQRRIMFVSFIRFYSLLNKTDIENRREMNRICLWSVATSHAHKLFWRCQKAGVAITNPS